MLRKNDFKIFKMPISGLFNVALVLFLFSCQQSTPDFAPKTIKDYVMAVTTTRAELEDTVFLHKMAYYVFDSSGNYVLYLEKEIYEEGEYAYQKMSADSASLIVSYSEPAGLSNYKLFLKFSSPEAGTWEGSYINDAISTESGSFTILKHG